MSCVSPPPFRPALALLIPSSSTSLILDHHKSSIPPTITSFHLLLSFVRSFVATAQPHSTFSTPSSQRQVESQIDISSNRSPPTSSLHFSRSFPSPRPFDAEDRSSKTTTLHRPTSIYVLSRHTNSLQPLHLHLDLVQTTCYLHVRSFHRPPI
jgi:hypothetical protein